jgi:hypothetical protein
MSVEVTDNRSRGKRPRPNRTKRYSVKESSVDRSDRDNMMGTILLMYMNPSEEKGRKGESKG